MSIYEILNYLFLFFFGFILFPIFTAIYRWKDLSKSDRLVYYFLVSILIIEVISDILRYSYIRNHFMHYPSTFFSLIFYTLYFSETITQQNLRKGMIAFCIFEILFLPIEIFLITGYNQINYISETLMFVGMALFSFIAINNILKQSIQSKESSKTKFAFSTAFLVVGLFSFVSSYFKKQFIESSLDLYYFFKMLSVIGSACAYIIFTIGFWIKPKSLLSKSKNE